MNNETLLPLLQTYYLRAFPERENARILGTMCLNTGWESDVYAFRVEWGQPGQSQTEDLILRIYPGQDAQPKSAAEYRSLKILHQAGYPVPRVDRLEQADSPFGKPFLIMEAIHGSSMWQPMFHAAPEEQQRLLAQFCGLQARLHALDWRLFDPESAAQGEPPQLIDRQMARWQPVLDAMPVPGMLPNAAWLMAHMHDTGDSHLSPVHWDFHPNNILLKDNGEAVVIDWTGLELTDYRFDLAWTLLLITSNEGSAWREPVLREYERQAGHPVGDMTFFDAAACFRRLYSVVVSITYGADKLGMRPGAETFMRQQAPSLRRVYEQLLAITHLPIPEAEAFLVSCGV